MNLSKLVKIGAWSLIILNILMSLGAIWTFGRMAPAIERIIARNGKSLESCEQMLTQLLRTQTNQNQSMVNESLDQFTLALETARNNITEPEESIYITGIETSFQAAFDGSSDSMLITSESINQLAETNRQAMLKADERAKKIGKAGAWGIVFMGLTFFFIAIIFLRSLQKNIISPLDELHATLLAHHNGDKFRRCGSYHPHPDIRYIYEGVNQLIDK